MAVTSARSRASTVAYTEAEAAELGGHLENLSLNFSQTWGPQLQQELYTTINATHCIRQSFRDNANPNRIRDAFRHLNGFQKTLAAFRNAFECLRQLEEESDTIHTFTDLFQSLFGLLTGALQDHWGNRKYFRKRVDGGGWDALKNILKKALEIEDVEQRRTISERLLGGLFACALDDDTLNGLFSTLRRRLGSTKDQHASSNGESSGREKACYAEEIIKETLGLQVFAHNPEAISVAFETWLPTARTSKDESDMVDSVILPLAIVGNCITGLSTHCTVALHSAGLLQVILPAFADATGKRYIGQLRKLALTLLTVGVTDLNDAHLLYRIASSSPLVAGILHDALKDPQIPPCIHFDLSMHGYASVELPDIGRSFPPVASSAGYTLSLWLQVVRFDPESHTTLFGAFDSSQTCFVLVYLEKDTRHLILQTSVTSSRPSVRFKSYAFKADRWYHLCLVHRRPKTTPSSKASLFIDGEFVEQIKAQYPSPPPTANPGSSSLDLPSTSCRRNPVQAFLGTPQDLASKLGRGVVSSQWRLASAYLFNDTLSDDLIAVHKQLGPRYHGNYQDCLGSFQTYEASAALNLRNESLHPGKEEKSEIVAAIRSKASVLLPENRILLNFSPMMVLDDDDRNNIDETQLIKALSKSAARNLRAVTRGGRTVIVTNGAIPSVNEALLKPNGFAVLAGEPAIVIPQSLDEAAWRIGGCAPVGLALVESASTRDDLVRALEVLLSSIQGSWRNSEAMERENGFGVLANLLTAKVDNAYSVSTMQTLRIVLPDKERDELMFEILSILLKFMGYQQENPADSVINNPLAYRILVVDLEIWRSSSGRVQELYYEQFSTFGMGSKHRLFNAKRLARMRILKKWLDALKNETFYAETFGYFLVAFRSLLTASPSADSLRNLALFVTYAVHTPKENISQISRAAKSIRRPHKSLHTPPRRSTTSSTSPIRGEARLGTSQPLTLAEIGVRVLEMYSDVLCQKDLANIKKFARTVTNKWLLHLLADDNPSVVILATKILARVLVTNGTGYVEKFTDKTGGFIIMRYRLKRWWNRTVLWTICFAILFGQDVANIDFGRPFDLYNLLATFGGDNTAKVTNPQILPVLTAMLQNGLKSVTKEQEDPESPLTEKSNGSSATGTDVEQDTVQQQTRVVSLKRELPMLQRPKLHAARLDESAKTLHVVTRFLADMHSKSQVFRDFTIASPYVQELLFLLFPIIVSSDTVSPETELHSRDASLTFNGNDVIIRPLSQISMKAAPIVRTTSIEEPSSPKVSKAQPLKRGSSYILVTSEQSEFQPSSARLQPVISPKDKPAVQLSVSNSLVEEILEILIAVFSDQILARKEFPGIGLFMKVPPGFQEHQAYFESFILRNTVSSLSNTIQLNQKLLWEPRVLTNLARFAAHLGEAVYEGWFIDGAEVVLEFLCGLLEYLQRPDIMQLKSVRLCSEIIAAMRTVISRIVLLRLSESDESRAEPGTVAFLNKITYWQTVLFAPQPTQESFLRLLCYLLYTKLMSASEQVREVAANIWRMLLVQRPDEAASVLYRMMNEENKHLTRGFQKILELDNASFLGWIDDHRSDLDAIFFGSLASFWEEFVSTENRRTEESAKARVLKRRERLRVWVTDDLNKEDVIRRHEVSTDHWRSNIYASENLKRQRALQDQQDTLNFNLSSWMTMIQQLHRPCGILDDGAVPKWQLDQTEGRNRMRLRMIPDRNAHLHNYQAKGATSKDTKSKRPLLDVRDKTLGKTDAPIAPSPIAHEDSENGTSAAGSATAVNTASLDETTEVDDGFEIVDDPSEGNDGYEDKNRKVMRSLQRGDQVEHVHNISRIIGLEAREGLLITGKKALYLIDNFFQRSDGEIVDAWQAPPDERDSYMQMISGREIGESSIRPSNNDHETRSWLWEDVLSISKRRFLFRDVGIEVFFVDGRSYLLTIVSPKLRDELFQSLQAKAHNAANGAPAISPEDVWRMESLRTPDDNPQTLGSKFTNVFSQASSNPATKKWIKGEMSNFHYLMLVNTMAGRTFNDLTQYPVFPWVLADYTSEELDLTNPRSFRDLSKAMGCQNPERQAEFRDRYQSFAEMGDHNSPPFHYGTHYSSAMIVTSYLIRMQPFVQSYLLLQGGSFDHPDRLFYSIEKAWSSASRDNMTDVRELIPEFYYLPDFLLNSNGYDFGSRQGTGGAIDTVVLPPWAKGDPKIFIAKHREALESDYVSKHLHQWIDLVFGHKQRGEAALEATNVFHHLSYRGAKNLDEIDDPVERLATIGIIHNFGQTPHQVFHRGHPQREDAKHRQKRLDTLANSLTRLPFPLLESQDRIASQHYSVKQDRLLCAGAFRLNIPPNCDKYMEWGFIDGSVRFYAADSKKLIGLFEHIHQGQLSSALFVDSRTLVTAGTDCTISIWQVVSASKTVDLNPRACLFGHRTSVTTLAASRSFRTLLSASSDGQVILWDLNRLDLVRVMATGAPVECARINDVSGTIMLCRGPEVALFTLNGDLLLEQHICAEGDEMITACAFYEGAGHEYMQQSLVFTGHRRGVVNIWNMAIHEGKFHLDHVKRLNHMDPAGFNFPAAITCILPLPQVVYTGDEDGRVVRAVAFPNPNLILSASRDGTVRVWKLLSPSPPHFDYSISSHGTAFVNAVAYVPPTADYPEGLVVSGGKDMIIEVRQPGKPPEENAERLLTGHAHNVCALDVSPDGGWVVSGSWDASARVWNLRNWECEAVLEEHEGSVWAVLAYDKETIITGCADKFIRIFSPTGKLLRTIKGSPDVIRALCIVPKGHESRADFASASNDGVIRLWQLNGRQVGELRSHESFIYSLASLPNGDIISSGEDRTVRVWRGNECIQTITHPAISVWGVAVCSENGDIVSGASDRIVRVFSRSTDRQAEAQVIRAFEESVKSSSIPQQQMGDVNKEQLPGPEFLTQKSGTKEGQVVMIKEPNGSVTAHQWSQGAQQWVNVGTVVDAVGSSGKRIDYLGAEYDYVFDVDIEEGKPPLKLPYNLSQNPYEAATKFIEDNELPIGYLDQVADFITKNTQGATIGQSSQVPQTAPPGADPWGMENRYRPGEASSVPTQPPSASTKPKILPQTQYLSIKTANLKTIQKKIEELNEQLITEGFKDVALDPANIEILRSLVKQLEQSAAVAAQASDTVTKGIQLVVLIISRWPAAQRLPGLDLLRLLAAATPSTAEYGASIGGSIVEVLEASGVFNDKDRSNSIMLAVRAFANLFETEQGRRVVDTKFAKIHGLVQSSSLGTTNRNLTVAVATLYINYAVLCTSPSHSGLPSSIDRGLSLLEDLAGMLASATDSEAVYRSLVATGTLLALGEEVQIAAKEVYDVPSILGKIERGMKEPRIQAVIAEIRGALG